MILTPLGDDAFFPAYHSIGLTFDDVTLATLYSEVLPRDTHLDTQLADGLRLAAARGAADVYLLPTYTALKEVRTTLAGWEVVDQ